MAIVNIGILAHVDAGKTTLTERILYETGVIRDIGSVDKGTTQTDTLDLERARGITIKSAVVSFNLGDLKVNLVDTPGHPDFIAEVERSLSVLDGVVLVISAVEGVQSQTRRLARAIRATDLPMLIFVNKIDRVGARCAALLDDIERKLSMRIVLDDGSRQSRRSRCNCSISPMVRSRLAGARDRFAGRRGTKQSSPSLTAPEAASTMLSGGRNQVAGRQRQDSARLFRLSDHRGRRDRNVEWRATSGSPGRALDGRSARRHGLQDRAPAHQARRWSMRGS